MPFIPLSNHFPLTVSDSIRCFYSAFYYSTLLYKRDGAVNKLSGIHLQKRYQVFKKVEIYTEPVTGLEARHRS